MTSGIAGSMLLFFHYTCLHEQYIGNTDTLQKIRQDFKERMKKTMVTSPIPPEPDPAEGVGTVPSETFPPQVLKSHHQHLANYVKLFLKEGEDLSMGDNQAALLVTEVFIHCFTLYDWSFILVRFYLIYCVFDCHSHLQALQNIQLVSHIKQMAEFLHCDAVQQLEVALLGTPMAQVIGILASGLASSPQLDTPFQPHPKLYTSASPSPHPPSVPIMGISSTIPKPTIASTSVTLQTVAPTALEGTDPEVYQHCQIIPIPIEPSSPSIELSSKTHPMVVAPECLILAEVYLECLNRSRGGKDYLCCLCLFRDSNLDIPDAHQEAFRGY